MNESRVIALEKWSDRLNPVLVKEIRAALRGRFFRASFAIVLSLATVATLGFVALSAENESARSGGVAFAVVFACLALAVHGLVPFAAMLSMTAENDEHTLELLQLSGLAGWRIVIGKLAAALVQGLLIYSAFLPFLMFAYLMQGVDIVTWLGLVGSSLVSCAAYSSLGILLGTLARARWARVLLLLLFAIVLLQSAFGGLTLLMYMSGTMAPSGFGTFAALGLVTGIAATGLFVVLAAARLAHIEENQATPLRVAVTLTLLGAIVACALISDPTMGQVLMFWALILCALPMFLAATEREALPRAVPARLPRSIAWRLAISPWLPGGARGALFVVIHLAILLVAFRVVLAVKGSPTYSSDEALARVFACVLLACAFVLLPAAICAPFTKTLANRTVVRLAIIGFFFAANIAPLFASFLMRADVIAGWTPLAQLVEVKSNGDPKYLGPYVVLVMCAIAGLVANVPRVIVALRELINARPRGVEAGIEGTASHAATER